MPQQSIRLNPPHEDKGTIGLGVSFSVFILDSTENPNGPKEPPHTDHDKVDAVGKEAIVKGGTFARPNEEEEGERGEVEMGVKVILGWSGDGVPRGNVTSTTRLVCAHM